MEYDEWEKMKEYEEGRSASQSLYDSMEKTINSMYDGMRAASYTCNDCNCSFSSPFNPKCPRCGSRNC